MQILCHHIRNATTTLRKFYKHIPDAEKRRQASDTILRIEKALRDYEERLGYDLTNATK